MLSAALPEFVRVIAFGALVVPTAWLPKLRLVGEKLTPAATPVPDRATVCGLPVALSVTVIVPGWLPVAVGVNVTLIAQFAPAATDAPHVLVCPYCALATMLVMLSAAVPEFVSVTLCAALVVLRF